MKHLLLFKAWLLFLFWVLPVEIYSATTMEDTNFSYSYCLGGVQITKFHGSYNEYRTITIPETFRGQKVVKIGNFAFQNASFARVVRIPKFVKEIGFRAFYALSDLEDIKFYDAIYYGSEAYKTELKYVGGECFMNCYKLKSVVFDRFAFSDYSLFSIESMREYEREIMNRSIIQVCSFLLSLTVMWKYEDIFFGTDVCGNLVIGVENTNETAIIRRKLKNSYNWCLYKNKIENTYYVDNKNC